MQKMLGLALSVAAVCNLAEGARSFSLHLGPGVQSKLLQMAIAPSAVQRFVLCV